MSPGVSAGERGSALVLALLVVFIMSLLGASFLMMSQTESRIARNETLAAQSRYVAEAGVLAVKRWFDRPGTAVGFPDEDDIEFGARVILDPSDPYGSTLGSTPEYKAGIDDDGAPGRDFLQRPYRGSNLHALMGTPAGPDIVIDDQDADSVDFLVALSGTLVGDVLPAGRNLEARISRIEVFAPPYVESGGSWTRMGVATVRVTGRIYRGTAGNVAAEQTVSAVLNEMPYGTPIFGPLHTCGSLTIDAAFPLHWGAITAKGPILHAGVTPESLPRAIPSGPRVNRWWTGNPADVLTYATTPPGPLPWPGDIGCSGVDVEDPWLRTIGESWVRDTDTSDDPYPEPDPLVTWQPLPYDWGGCTNRSNIVAGHPLVSCPDYDYDFWKRVARSGAAGVHYYEHVSGDTFSEDGGSPETFRVLTENAVGLQFFDTNDSLPPRDDDGNGVVDNLTPQVVLVGGWNPRGFVYLNSTRLVISGLTAGPATAMRPPGEPWIDGNGDGVFTGAPDEWVNLAYPADLATPPSIDPGDTIQDDGSIGIVVRNTVGQPISAEVNLHGILFNNGALHLTGPVARFYGGLIARGDVQIDGGTFDPQEGVYWDDSIGRDWPPPGLGLPLVAISRWDSLP